MTKKNEIILAEFPQTTYEADGTIMDIKHKEADDFIKAHKASLTGDETTDYASSYANFVTRVENGKLQLVATNLKAALETIKKDFDSKIKLAHHNHNLVRENEGVQIVLPGQVEINPSQEELPFVKNGTLHVKNNFQLKQIRDAENRMKKSEQTIFGKPFDKLPKGHTQFILNEKHTNQNDEILILPQTIDHEEEFKLKVSVFENNNFAKPINAKFDVEALSKENKLEIAQSLALPPDKRKLLKVQAETVKEYDFNNDVTAVIRTKSLMISTVVAIIDEAPFKNAS